MFYRDVVQIVMKICNRISLFLNLNYKKNRQMTLTGMFIENNDENNLLRLTKILSLSS